MDKNISQDNPVIAVPAADATQTNRKKVIVAVHGIGDQFEYATVQSTAIQFCNYYDVPAAVPLGRFHSHLQQIKLTGAFFWGTPPDPPFQELGFAEVYWAGIPREQVKLGYILEESKRWAKTVVERFRAHAIDAEIEISKETYSLIDTVLEEMIETIAILERLTFLAEKAGVFKFDLNGLLVNYLGDVQLVTEFTLFRDKILTEFDNVMDAIMQNNSDADIYIVAHSEGTVVSFKGLLKAMCNTRTAGSDWIKNVRGFMTIGSPIDKHVILWPELWED
ncbi:MAG TPA: MFS transporter, partial [Blastocatellia bacterium]|nr:MFS transporter [Blastocatellia bacterium]